MNPRRADLRRAVHTRIRKKVRGSAESPRLAIFRSLNHIYAQVIDDEAGEILVSASTTEKDLRGKTSTNLEAAQRVGRAVAERAIAAGISNVVFDRGGYVYHGRVKALTDAAREAGLKPIEDIKTDINNKSGEGETEEYVEQQIQSFIKEIELKNKEMDKAQMQIEELRFRSAKRQKRINSSLKQLKGLLDNV